MLLVILICTLVGWLCGYPVLGLVIGLLLFALALGVRR